MKNRSVPRIPFMPYQNYFTFQEKKENMNIKIFFFFALFLMFVLHPLYASESTWLVDGKPVQDIENLKSIEDFGAQLWLTKDDSFYEKWNNPQPPMLTLTKRGKRNELVSTVILFINPGVNDKNLCDVTGDILIRQPDGNVYADITDFEIWKNRPSPPKSAIQLAEQNIKIMIEDKDPLGKYSIDVLVKDNTKKITIPLHYEFIAEE